MSASSFADLPAAGVGLRSPKHVDGSADSSASRSTNESVGRSAGRLSKNQEQMLINYYISNPKDREILERIYQISENPPNSITEDLINKNCKIYNNINIEINKYIKERNWSEEKRNIYKKYNDVYKFNEYLRKTHVGENRNNTNKYFDYADRVFFYKIAIASDMCKHFTALKKSPHSLQRKSKIYIYFMRHSESCANVMKKNITFGKIRQSLYTDPELSYRGEKMAEDMAAKFFAANGTYSKLEGTKLVNATMLNNDKEIPVGTLFGASNLIRAQQTAKIMQNERVKEARSLIYKYPNIFEFPYIHEVGGGQENTRMSDALRNKLSNIGYGNKVNIPHLIREHIHGIPDINKSNINKFFDWLGKNMGNNIYERNTLIYPTTEPRIFQMIIVTHHGVLKQLMKQFGTKTKSGTKIEFNNLDGIEFSIEYDEYGNRIDTQLIGDIYRYVPPPTIPLSCPESENTACRKPVCGVPYRDQPQSICDLIAAAKRVAERVPDKNRTRNNRTNNKHGSKFITLHVSHPIQDIDYNTHIEPLITAIHKNRALFPQADTSNLEKYKKPGYFSRQVRRNMDYLYEDLNDISYAVNCSVAPPAEAAQQPPVEAAQQPPAEEAQPGSSKSEAPPVIQSIVPATSSKKKSSPSSIKENNTSPFGSKLPSTKMRPVSPPKSVQPVIVRSSSTPTSKKPKSSENRSLLLSASEVGISSPTKGGATRKKLRKHLRASRKKHRRN